MTTLSPVTGDDLAGLDDAGGEGAPSRRELAVARSLDPARVRAEKRVQRFLDAAVELMASSSGKEFTVQEVVEASGQSLRSFYQYFAGKHELLLALFEEAVRKTAGRLQAEIDEETEPLERLRRFAVVYYESCRPAPGNGSGRDEPLALAEFAQQLLTAHPKEASRAFGPIVELLEGVLDDAAAAGVIRPAMGTRRVAGVILQAVMFNAFAATISGSPVESGDGAAEELWQLILHGIGADASA
jgi:AcrR family transcriptional regulator